MNNAEMFIVPLQARIVEPKEWQALLDKFKSRLDELKQQGWKPSSGWATEEPSDGPRSA